MLQIDLLGKILGRSIAAINVGEPTDMGGIVVALSGNLMMEINFRRGGNERETEIDMIGCQKRRFIPALSASSWPGSGCSTASVTAISAVMR